MTAKQDRADNAKITANQRAARDAKATESYIGHRLRN